MYICLDMKLFLFRILGKCGPICDVMPVEAVGCIIWLQLKNKQNIRLKTSTQHDTKTEYKEYKCIILLSLTTSL